MFRFGELSVGDRHNTFNTPKIESVQIFSSQRLHYLMKRIKQSHLPFFKAIINLIRSIDLFKLRMSRDRFALNTHNNMT